MSNKTYEDRIKNVTKWVNIHNKYWHKYEGNLHNRKDHWDDTFHSQTDSDHEDWVEVADILEQEFPEIFARYPYIFKDTKTIKDRLTLGKPVTKKHLPDYNLPVFRAWMIIKDIFNSIAGSPTKRYPKPGDPKPKVTPGLQRQRAQTDKVNAKAAMFESLFEIENKNHGH
jgi:hypothetical protein